MYRTYQAVQGGVVERRVAAVLGGCVGGNRKEAGVSLYSLRNPYMLRCPLKNTFITIQQDSARFIGDHLRITSIVKRS